MQLYSKIGRTLNILTRLPIVLVNLVYSSYLTLRFVDQYDKFPAISIVGAISFKITKGSGAQLIIRDQLKIMPWLLGNSPSCICIGNGGCVEINGEFIIGDDVRINVESGARLIIGGKENESASGITMRSVVLVYKELKIGKDCIIAWDTFITDCDWHYLEGSETYKITEIGDHVWIAAGAKVLKGARIGNDSIVAAQSVVNSGDYPAKSLLAGAPAKIVKSPAPEWHRDMR